MSVNEKCSLFTLIASVGFVLALVGNFVSAKSHVTHATSIAKDQHPTCKDSRMLHSDIVTNGSLNAKREHANLTFLGRVKNMKECLGLCCSHKKCKLAYFENNTMCFSSSCTKSNLCRIVRHDKQNISNNVQMSLMVRHDQSKKVYVTAYIVMALASFGAAISGTVWVAYVLVKKYRENTTEEKESEKPAGEPQIY